MFLGGGGRFKGGGGGGVTTIIWIQKPTIPKINFRWADAGRKTAGVFGRIACCRGRCVWYTTRAQVRREGLSSQGRDGQQNVPNKHKRKAGSGDLK